MHTEFWWGSLLEDAHFGDEKDDEKVTLSWFVGRSVMRMEGV
jgi:hypothetical protein